MLREDGAIAPLVLPPLTPHERIFKEFDAYLRLERGLAGRTGGSTSAVLVERAVRPRIGE